MDLDIVAFLSILKFLDFGWEDRYTLFIKNGGNTHHHQPSLKSIPTNRKQININSQSDLPYKRRYAMPSQFKELCLGFRSDGHSKTQIGKSFPSGYTYSRTIGWIWTSKDDNMIPLYSSRKGDNWKLQTNKTLSPGFSFTQGFSSSGDPAEIGFIYPDTSNGVRNRPAGMIDSFLVSGIRTDLTPDGDTLVTIDDGLQGAEWDNKWTKNDSLGYILTSDMKIAQMEYLDYQSQVPEVIEPIIVMAKPVDSPPSAGKTVFDLWNRFTATFSWDNATRIAPGIQHTNNLPLVQELSASGTSIPSAAKMTNSTAQIVTTQLQTILSSQQLTFNMGEVNELGNDSEITATWPTNNHLPTLATGEKLQAVLVVSQAALSVRFRAKLTRINSLSSSSTWEYGTYTCINSTGVSAYIVKVSAGQVNAQRSDYLPKVQPVQLGRNRVVQYGAQTGKKADNTRIYTTNGTIPTLMPTLTRRVTNLGEDQEEAVSPIVVSDIQPKDFVDQADTAYYSNITVER